MAVLIAIIIYIAGCFIVMWIETKSEKNKNRNGKRKSPGGAKAPARARKKT